MTFTIEERREYYKKYFQNPVNKAKQLARVKKYNHTAKGREARKLWVKKNKAKMSEYFKKHRDNRYKEAKANGICTHCFKVPAKTNYVLCEKCLTKNKLYQRKKNEVD